MKRLLVVVIGLLWLLNGHAQRIVLTPQWTAQSQFAGYYVAEEKGYYKDCGLDVSIEHPSASNPALNRLLEGKSQIITLQLIQAMKTIDQGIPLVNILQTSQTNALMIISRHNIHSLQELRGKKVGKWIAGFDELAQILDSREKLNIEWIPFISNVNLFVSGAIDATLAMSYNEYFQIASSGIRLSPSMIFKFSELGFNIPEDGLYVTAQFYRTHKEQLTRFAEASRRGWEWTEKHPEEALEIVMKRVRQAKIGTNKAIQKWMLTEILSQQKEKNTGKATFILQPERVKEASDLLFEYRLINKPITYQQITGGAQ